MSNTKGILTTTGVLSEVYNSEDDVIGHITLADYDDTCGADYDLMLDDIKDLPGITVVLESSPQSYHVWNLSVRDKLKTAEQKMQLHDDAKHLCIGYRRGRWALRLAGKYEPNGDVYKSEPELDMVLVNPTDLKQSKPHFNLLKALAEKQDFEIGPDTDSLQFTGKSARTEQYMTLVDELKRFGGGDD